MFLPNLQFSIGETVYDDLTKKPARIIGITCSVGKQGTHKGAGTYPDEFWVIGYWVDNTWVDGGRHPWEISKLPVNEDGCYIEENGECISPGPCIHSPRIRGIDDAARTNS